jgi:signal transduction histidine kinase
VNPLRTVGGRLALALLVVVAGALTIVYIVVVPSYESSLVEARINELRQTLRTIVAQPPTALYLSQEWVEEEAAPLADARVIVLQRRDGRLFAFSDSSPPGGSSRDVANDSIAMRALEQGGMVSGTVSHLGERFAEAAVPLTRAGPVVMVSSSLENDLDSVSVVRSRVIVAGALATLFAIVLGYALATLFARRIRRLEVAATRIADGRFDEPVIDTAPDEVGQLARAFDRMRLRLASLERARAEFIANASHELRTPLFSLGGFLELLDSEELDGETRAEFVTAMHNQVTRLTKLATDLLDLSKLDAGRMSVESEGLDLGPLGESLATEFGPRAAASGHLLETDVDGAVYAWGDEQRVLQIGRVLLENALVHTPPGTAVRVTAALQDGRPTLSVADDGPGIPADVQSHVFERFYRHAGERASGSGLGLAIARELALLMGGTIEVESRPGATRFTLGLPVETPERLREFALA